MPYVELDAFHHGPNWTDVPTDEFRKQVAAAVAAHGWVVDGNYAKARDLIWGRVETVLWLDYPFPVMLGRLMRRTFGRCIRREEIWHGNREILWRHLCTRDSLFWWLITTYRQRRAECDQLFSDPAYQHLTRIRLKSHREAQAILDSLG